MTSKVVQPDTTIYDIAEAIAPTWERRRAEIEEVAAPVREWMVRELAPQLGDTVLELAAGAGDTGFEVAAIIGPDGRLISSDLSPRMLEAARRRGDELGLGNVEYRTIDAERIDLESDSVDGVVCRFGYMLMADPAAAFAETGRVLRPGGRLALAVWGPPDRNPYFSAIAGSLVEYGHMPPPDPAGPGLFSLARDSGLTELLEESGFDSVRTEEVPVRFSVGGTEQYVDMIADTAGPLGLTVQALTPDERQEVEEHAGATLARFADAGGALVIPGVALCAVARIPSPGEGERKD
jgi:ubiquinone/menaquinone biosynthesis C-methylase UbiE